MSNPEPLRPGDPARVAAYGIIARLGEGGQGVVYLGRSPEGAAVAVKLLRSDLAQDEEALARFVRGVSTTVRVAAFCTAQVIETGVDDRRPYIVSEYIEGPTLEEVVRRDGPRQGSALQRLAIGTVTALVAIHRAGIVHRDFKPSNVLLGADGPRVIDFGIAKALDQSSTLTSTVVGTPAYITPEQLGGEPAGPAADMFSWAGAMVFAATGKTPFGADSLPAVFHRIMNLEPELGSLEEPLRGIVTACLAKDPAARPAADDVLMRLLGHDATAPPAVIMAEGSAAAQVSQSVPGRRRRPPSRTEGRAPKVAVAVVAGLVVLGTGGYLIIRPGAQDGVATRRPGQTGSPVTRDSTPGPAGTTAPAGTGAASVSPTSVPPATRTIDLPGSSITVQENDSDPIKLTSYSLDGGKRVYIRPRGENSFTRTTRFFEYAVGGDGRWALGTDTMYTADGYSTVSLVDRVTGRTTMIRMSRAPVYPAFPQWSPDGTKVLVTLNEAVGDTGTTRGYGYAIIDVARKKAGVVHVVEKDVGDWTYFWRGDGNAVGTWTLNAGTRRVRFYDLEGAVLRTLPDVGAPLTVEGDDVSPSGTLFMTRCPNASAQICVWTGDGQARARFSFPTDRLIGWYDDQHVVGWRKRGEGYEAVVVDFQGQATRVLATAEAGEYKKQYLRYTRGA
jgi:predicted Ser/Thr protein kinase